MRASAFIRRTALLAIALVLACDGGNPAAPEEQGPAPVASVQVLPGSFTIAAGETAQLWAVARASNGDSLPGRAISWSSSDTAVVVVSAAGLAAARGEGTATISARSDSRVGRVVATVQPAAAASVEIHPGDAVLEAGQTAQLRAVVRAATGDSLGGRLVEWESRDTTVAAVSAAGLVEARAPGVTRIVAASGGRADSVVVAVQPPPSAPVARVIFLPADPGLEPGENMLLQVRLEDAAGAPLDDRQVSWSSSNPAAVSVAADGRVTARGVGSAAITAHSEGQQASMTIVVAPAPAFGLLYDRVSASGDEIFYLDLMGSTPLRLNAGNVSGHPSPSPDGSRVVFAVAQTNPATGQLQHDLYMVDRNGMNMRWLTRMAGIEMEPAWSPDGTRIAFSGAGALGDQDIFVMNADGTGLVNLTPNSPLSYETEPAWSADGQYLAFTSLAPVGGMHVYTIRADGSGDPNRVASAAGTSDRHPTWAPTGYQLAFSRTFADGESDLMTITMNGNDLVRLRVPGEQREPAWSPDGRHFAFSATVSGESQLFTMRADGSTVRQRTPVQFTTGGRNAAWVAR